MTPKIKKPRKPKTPKCTPLNKQFKQLQQQALACKQAGRLTVLEKRIKHH
jgi:hypothetical protein